MRAVDRGLSIRHSRETADPCPDSGGVGSLDACGVAAAAVDTGDEPLRANALLLPAVVAQPAVVAEPCPSGAAAPAASSSRFNRRATGKPTPPPAASASVCSRGKPTPEGLVTSPRPSPAAPCTVAGASAPAAADSPGLDGGLPGHATAGPAPAVTSPAGRSGAFAALPRRRTAKLATTGRWSLVRISAIEV
jgi:hypothetical protein